MKEIWLSTNAVREIHVWRHFQILRIEHNLTDTDGEKKYSLRSVNRALDVLQALANGDSQGMGVGDIAAEISVSRSTAFSLLQTLLARGFVSDNRIGGGRLYRLGLALVNLGDKVASDFPITQIATPLLQKLADTTKLTSRLAILDDGYAVSISQVDGPGIFRLAASLGRRELPHCSALGKALLAQLPADKVIEILTRLGMPRRTEHTLTMPQDLVANLSLVSEMGYAIDNEEDNMGVVCFGAPIYDRAGNTVAAISVTALKLDKNDEDLARIGKTVKEYADQITERLGRGS